jgi:uncharacterized protein
MFKPVGVPLRELEEVVMTLDEFEALRLADLEELYQEEAAARMEISRPTFGRVLKVARRKVAEVLVHGKVLRIEGGPVCVDEGRCCRGKDRARCMRRVRNEPRP